MIVPGAVHRGFPLPSRLVIFSRKLNLGSCIINLALDKCYSPTSAPILTKVSRRVSTNLSPDHYILKSKDEILVK